MDIFINNHASIPIYEQISSQIKAMIINGDLKAGEALPSIRGLAKSLHISVLTVQKSYDVLQKDGFIETTAGKGCFVFGRTAKENRKLFYRSDWNCKGKRNKAG